MKITNFDPDHSAQLGNGGGVVGGPAGGDLGGTLPAPTVAGIQGVPILATPATDGQVLTYVAADGEWEPKPTGSGPPLGPAGGDLAGSYPNPSVANVNGVAVGGTAALGRYIRATGSATAGWDTIHAPDYAFHDEPLTDGASNFIFAGGDVVVVTGLPN
jgi:hypothetical protein